MLASRLRLAASALPQCAGSIGASEAAFPKPFLGTSLPLVSLRAFSKGDPAPAAPPPPPPPEGDSPAAADPNPSAETAPQASARQGAEGSAAASSGSAGEAEAAAGGDGRDGAIKETLRAQIQAQITQLRSSSTVTEQTMEDPLPGWQRALVDRFGAWFSLYFADFVRSRIEKEFDLTEFLEGAKDAFWMVHNLMGKEDFDTLRTMASAKLLNAVQTTAAEYREGGLVWRTEIDPDVPLDAQLQRVSLWSAAQIAEYDAEAAAAAPADWAASPLPAGRWLVMYVKYKAAQRTLITREEDGQVVAQLTDRRPAVWTFAAGPLPEGCPVPRLETPYWLLKFS